MTTKKPAQNIMVVKEKKKMEISIMREKLTDGSEVFNVTYQDELFGGTKITFGMISEAAATDLAAALADCAWLTVD